LHDAVQFERLGIPATLVMTEPFQGLAAGFAAKLGAPGYPGVMVPHPVAVRDETYLEDLARRIVDDVVKHLTT
jgi:hypothetical protein